MRLGGSIEMLGFWIFIFLLGALSRLELCKMLNGNFIRPGGTWDTTTLQVVLPTFEVLEILNISLDPQSCPDRRF